MKKLTIILAVALLAAAPSVALAKKVHHPKAPPAPQYSSDFMHLLHDMVTGN
jgi:hypothetical protein